MWPGLPCARSSTSLARSLSKGHGAISVTGSRLPWMPAPAPILAHASSSSEDYLFEWISFLLRKYGIRHLVFTDDQFAASRPRLIRLCEKLAGGGLEIQWNCDARVDSVDPDLLKLMKRAGCWMISYGIESGSQKILDQNPEGDHPGPGRAGRALDPRSGDSGQGPFHDRIPAGDGRDPGGDPRLHPAGAPSTRSTSPFSPPTRERKSTGRLKGSPGFRGRLGKDECPELPSPAQGPVPAGNWKKAYGKIIRRFYLRPGPTFSYLSLLLESPENRCRLAAGLSRWLLRR